MADIKWIKLSVNMFDDEKIKLLESMPEGDTMIVIWCKLLTMAGKGNHRGYIMLTENFPYTEDMLMTIINRPAATVKMALQMFQRFGMIEFDEEAQAFALPNWGKHQNLDGLDRQRELNRQRQQKYRERKSTEELPPPDNVTPNDEVIQNNANSNVTRNDDVTQNNGPREEKGERREEKERKENKDLKEKDKPVDQQADPFESIWKQYPKKVDKKKALAAYKRAIKKGATPEEIERGLHQYLRYLKMNDDWLNPQDGGRWFEKERWTDEYDMTPQKGSRTKTGGWGNEHGNHSDSASTGFKY